MRLLRRALAAGVLLLSSAGVVLCVAGVIGVWWVRADVMDAVEKIDARLAQGVQRASAVNTGVRRALDQARADVGRVRSEAVNLGPGKNGLAAAAVRKLVREQVGPHVGDVGGRLVTGAEAAAAVAALLQSASDLPFAPSCRIDPERLGRAADEASALVGALDKLQATVGDAEQADAGPEVGPAAGEVDSVLQRCQAVVDDWQSSLDAVRGELAEFKARILGWVTFAALGATAVLAWLGLGQLSLFVHAWGWLRG